MIDESLKRSAFYMPVVLLLAACSASGQEVGSGEAPETTARVESAVVVATVKPSDQQTIEVMQIGEDLMGVVETRGPDFDASKAVSLLNFQGGSMAEFYARVAGAAIDRVVFDKLELHGLAARELSVQLAREGVKEQLAVEDLQAGTFRDDGVADGVELAAPGIHTLATGLDCAQSGEVYTHYASGWAGANCPNPRGWEDSYCLTDKPSVTKGWTHGVKWWARAQNMSRCNTAKMKVKFWNDPANTVSYMASVTLGLNGGYDQWWETKSRDWRYYATLEHLTGNEYPHLNYVLYRQW